MLVLNVREDVAENCRCGFGWYSYLMTTLFSLANTFESGIYGALCLILGIQIVTPALELVVKWPMTCPQIGRKFIHPSYDFFSSPFSIQLFPRLSSGLTRH